MKDLISIIVPIYNIQNYIQKCIDSILIQTYKNLEIILVNDGSTDHSLKIITDYIQKDNRIILVDKNNGGLSSARNAGIKKSQGSYIVFVDGDDYLHEDYIKNLYDAIIKTHADMSVCGAEIVDTQGEKTNILATGNKYVEFIPFQKEIIAPHEVERRYYIDNNSFFYVVAWNKMYKREIFNDLCYDENKIYEDEFLFQKLLRKCNTISFIPDKLYYYVQRNSGITSKKNVRFQFQLITEIFERRMACYEKEQESELKKLCCIKYLRQSITSYYYLDNKGKREIKAKYKMIIRIYNIPFEYKVIYYFIGILSSMKKYYIGLRK